jgi:hypothetical protein
MARQLARRGSSLFSEALGDDVQVSVQLHLDPAYHDFFHANSGDTHCFLAQQYDSASALRQHVRSIFRSVDLSDYSLVYMGIPLKHTDNLESIDYKEGDVIVIRKS